MSKIGKKPILIPEGVTLQKKSRAINVSGPKGELSLPLPEGLEIVVKENIASIVQKKNSIIQLVGLQRKLIANAVLGVTQGWTKTLELIGTGYRARLEGKDLILALGFSHPTRIESIPGISFSVEENKIRVSGVNRELVGQISANIRKLKPPEPYQGKGIRYENEYIRRKAGKSAKTETKTI